MKVLIFGATGMVGQGVLRECLLDPKVTDVVSIARRPLGRAHPRLREIEHADMTDFSAILSELTGFDACFFCLGISSVGMSEADYSHITYDMPVAAAQALLETSPQAVFILVSGAGADSSEQRKVMWARVKGRAENAVLKLPLRGTYIFRPGGIRPMHGITSRTVWYRMLYTLTAPLWAVLHPLLPRYVTSTEQVGRAMLRVARDGAPERILDSAAINRLGASA
jgi:uncharacterized protein YbjT (DUF2867 family)